MASTSKRRRKPSRLLRWGRALIWLINLGAVLLLLCAYLSTVVDPADHWWLAPFGMAYPYLLAINLFFVVWWLIFRRRRIWPSLITILLGWGFVMKHVQFFGRTKEPHGLRSQFTLMSWNVRLFNLYNWTHNQQTRDEIMELIRVEDPDILCLQEFLNVGPGNPLMVKDSLLSSYRYSDCADHYTVRTRTNQFMGIAIFSTFPILAQGTIKFPDEPNNLCLWADVALPEDTIRVYTAHLASLRFGDDDYAFIRHLDVAVARDSLASGSWRLLGRLKDAFIRRSSEVAIMARHMEASPWPVVYCGDLNDTPISYSYHSLLRAGLSDAFIESGKGFGHTYIGDVPSFRIDHILHGPEFRSWGFRTLPDELSDHHAIITSLGVKR